MPPPLSTSIVKDRLGTKTVWCVLLRLLLGSPYFVHPGSPYTCVLRDLTTGHFTSRSLHHPSVRSIPTEVNCRAFSESRDVSPDHGCHSKAPFQSLRNQTYHLSLSPSRRSSANHFSPTSGYSSFLTQPSTQRAYVLPTNLSLGARLYILHAVKQGILGQGLSLRNRKALTAANSILLAISNP